MNKNIKENIQYATAIFTLLSGIVLCFLSFFFNKYDIESGVLMYFGQTLVFCGAIFGINLFIKTKIIEAETKIQEKMQNQISEYFEKK